MIDDEKRRSRQLAKEKVRRRMQVQVDPANYQLGSFFASVLMFISFSIFIDL